MLESERQAVYRERKKKERKVKVQNGGYFLAAKISNIFYGVLGILDIFWGWTGDAGCEPTYEEEMRVPPWDPKTICAKLFSNWPSSIWQKDFLKCFLLVAMAARILHGMKIFERLWKGTTQGYSCEVWWNSTDGFRRRFYLKERTTDIIWSHQLTLNQWLSWAKTEHKLED